MTVSSIMILFNRHFISIPPFSARRNCYGRLTFVLVALALGGCALHSPAVVNAGPPPPVGSTGASGFAARLYDQLRGQRGNLFFSPASIRMALAMTYAGAAGETATQLRLGLDLPDGDAAHAAMAATRARWQALDGSSRIVLRVANRLWGQRGTHFEPPFLTLARDRYGAPLGEVDFVRAREASRREINGWVSAQTEHKIAELIPPGALDADTRLVLTNAVYLNARWTAPFAPRDTQPAPFLGAGHDVQVQLMRQKSDLAYADLEGGQLLELNYGDGKLVMDVLLPDRANGLAKLEEQLVDGALPGWLARLSLASVDAALPRFHSSAQLSLKPLLEAMGMSLPFDRRGADFSGITGGRDLFLSEALHQAVITVDEYGTEAAAATAIVGEWTSAVIVRKQAVFRADHPFLYLIRERDSDEILFLGRLVDPSAP
jgi:serpin B